MEDVVTSAPAGEGHAPSTRSVDELWLDVLQQVCGRTAHELKGALNGVAVNLEVVRSRSTRPEAAAASVSPFASSAADQLEAVVDISEALLKLARAPREPVDVTETVANLTSLLAPSARVDGGSLRVELPSRELTAATVRPRGNVVRLVIGASLLAALSRKGDIRCRVHLGEAVVVHVECADAEGQLELPADVLAAAAGSEITVQGEGQSISLAFPRAGAARTRTPERA
jgi:signal transduction histidine kinase